jgi:hypothetical protein
MTKFDLIDNLTTSVSAIVGAKTLIEKGVELEDREDGTGYMLLSHCCRVWREIADGLPDALRSDEFDEVVGGLYLHQFSLNTAGGWDAFNTLLNKAHAVSYELWNERNDAREALNKFES